MGDQLTTVSLHHHQAACPLLRGLSSWTWKGHSRALGWGQGRQLLGLSHLEDASGVFPDSQCQMLSCLSERALKGSYNPALFESTHHMFTKHKPWKKKKNFFLILTNNLTLFSYFMGNSLRPREVNLTKVTKRVRGEAGTRTWVLCLPALGSICCCCCC